MELCYWLRGLWPSFISNISSKFLFLILAFFAYQVCGEIAGLRAQFSSLLLDCAPSFLAVIVVTNLNAFLFSREYGKTILASTLGLLGYELLQIYISERTFDYLDISATIGAGLFIYSVLIFLRRMKKAQPDGLGI